MNTKQDSWFSLLIVILFMLTAVFGGGYVISDQVTKFVGSLQFANSEARFESVER